MRTPAAFNYRNTGRRRSYAVVERCFTAISLVTRVWVSVEDAGVWMCVLLWAADLSEANSAPAWAAMLVCSRFFLLKWGFRVILRSPAWQWHSCTDKMTRACITPIKFTVKFINLEMSWPKCVVERRSESREVFPLISLRSRHSWCWIICSFQPDLHFCSDQCERHCVKTSDPEIKLSMFSIF